MINELTDLLNKFPGAANRTRCFAHIINLVAKSIIKQFDVPKADPNEVLDDAAKELATLATDLDIEERSAQESRWFEDDDENEDDSLDGWADVRSELSDRERKALDESLQPVRLVLVKVS
jgi:hypothetical protein